MRERFETFSLTARLLFFKNYTCPSLFLPIFLDGWETESATKVARVAPFNPFVAGVHF